METKIKEETLCTSDVQKDIDLLVYILPDITIAKINTDAIHRALIDLIELRNMLTK